MKAATIGGFKLGLIGSSILCWTIKVLGYPKAMAAASARSDEPTMTRLARIGSRRMRFPRFDLGASEAVHDGAERIVVRA
jgi:hypothetical protein